MSEKIKDIAMRIRDLREILELSAEDAARLAKMTLKEYTDHEDGKYDFSISALFNIANAFGVGVTDLLSGDRSTLSGFVVTRAGGGFAVDRQDAYSYKHLAFPFKDRLSEIFMVTLEPDAPAQEREHNHHEGQEFGYIVSGSLMVKLGEHEIVLNKGDSIFFESSVPHLMRALNGEMAVFIAVVMK